MRLLRGRGILSTDYRLIGLTYWEFANTLKLLQKANVESLESGKL